MAKHYLLLLPLLLFPLFLNAQRVVYGTLVDDKTGQPVNGCRVFIKNTRQFVQSDSLGRFEIELDSTQQYLEISDPAKRFAFHTIYLRKQQTDLKELRLRRYETVVDPSTVIYRPNFFNKRHPTPPAALDDPLSLLQGRFPGLLVARPGSDPNETYTLRFHGLTDQSGNNAPAIWLNGVPVSDLSMVNPAEIASIEVLPNLASAAAYGWGSAAGVILVNTQSVDFDEWHVTYEGGFSAAKATRVPEVGTAAAFRQQGTGFDFLRTTPWLDLVQQQGNSHTHHLAVTGGKQWLALRAGLSFADRQGILQNSQYQQYQGNVSLSSYLPKQRLNLQAAWLGSSRTSNFSFPDVFRYALNANPTLPVRDLNDPNFNSFNGYGQTFQFEHYNPVALLEQSRDLGIRTGQTAILGASWRAKRRWSVTTHWSYQTNALERGAFYDEQSLWRTTLNQVPGSKGRIDLTSEQQQRLFGNTILQFSQYFKNKSRLTLRGGGYLQDVRFGGQWRSGGRISKRVSEIGSLADIQTTNSEDLAIDAGFYDSLSNRYQLLGTLAEVSWRSPSSAWVLTAGIRSEQGASSQVRTHNTPYQLVQYNLNKWLKIKELYHLHLQASRGEATNENVQGRWSTRNEWTVGAQLETQNHRWFVGVQQFNNKGAAYGLFNQSSFPFKPFAYQGRTQVKNQGWEWCTRWKVVESRQFAWSVSANLSTLRTTLQDTTTLYFTSPGAPGNGNTYYHKSYPGAGWGELWGLVEKSVDANGAVRYVDANGNGFEDLGDYRQRGSGTPRRWWGIQNVLIWKQLRLDVNLRGVADHALAHENRAFYEVQGQASNWLVTRYSSPLRQRQTPFYNRFVEDATFWRLDDLRLTWTIPLRQSSRLDWFVGGQNLWTSTQYTGNDPEVRIAGDRGAEDSGSEPAYSTPTDPRAIGIDRRGTYWLEKAFYTGVRLRL